ncbi:similar to Saccharomyces cerevisiae YEL001C IRC22 Putative protein of unknown function [Maudiozyma barnettii]|uniref:Increased recombination centers protein 22 n=1 Tax=Maudiozyma barnettii TaxID=61262 RepID=A0A8H2VEE7_9SACH|nr:Irc22p [Kazachstania barnettii]CAB4254074.1 similar to Saccharomyces cerevisiae YEL001C IRC22 Putative protein of unknown function [Kazachstania barnettii]CAD1781824.1 similar to Saccharomyces cerevisiae YEL001C IRC22 Putative protein of unknown function [Kazachstania barnettii]
MKFSKLSLLALLSATTILGQQVEGDKEIPENDDTIVIDGSANANERPTANVTITYTILEKPPYQINDFLEFETEDVATLNYTITNNENVNYTLNSVGGAIMRFEDSVTAANITSGKFDPVLRLNVNQTVSVQQRVTFLDMKDDDYYIQPKVYVQELDSPKELELGAPLTLMTIMKPPMSLFDPQFLSIQILIVGVIGAVSYFFLNYTLNGKKKNNNNSNKTTNANNKKIDTSSFLPEQYKK